MTLPLFVEEDPQRPHLVTITPWHRALKAVVSCQDCAHVFFLGEQAVAVYNYKGKTKYRCISCWERLWYE